ncbi:Ribosome-releasing factor 2, mitochondrial [Orbilia oligospora]|uniref:Elongation factor 2 n=1 Tax=Orbilia oligospora TaxID=2813651 RepID=A0A7C8U492_ORBOL|nr:Ribosome-releasing factor 2, mitochondrial [Orbilia oligospora]
MGLTVLRTTTVRTARQASSWYPYTRIRLLTRPIDSYRSFSTTPRRLASLHDSKVDLKHVRNIGIIAHIDAGKTTTTERMLFYSGTTNRIGDVDEGSTVMDYLPEEKQRGITITSAAITLEWPPSPPHATTKDILSLPIHTINLIDTPGHADFTFEVERSIRVLDGAVTILDGVAGVEAQTETVWRQADRYHIPRIIYVNKMDREGAVFGRVVKDIAARLNVWPAVTQIPIHGNMKEGLLGGVVDLLHMNIVNWKHETEGRGMTLTPLESIKEKHPELYAEAIKARTALVELLAEWDEAILSKFVETEDQASITAEDLKRALRFCTLNPHTRVIPVLMGASRVNMGVQPVLDAVLDYLPDPTECGKGKIPVTVHGEKALLDAKEASKVCALVFKVMHDPKRGMLSYVRVYSGTLRAGDQLYNTTLQSRERALKLLRMYANEAVDIPSIRTGHIGVIVNYKNSRTGDTLIHADHVTNLPTSSSSSSVQNFKQQKREKKFKKKVEKAGKHIDILTDASLQLRPIDVPPPVFFASLEPNSAADERGMQDALSIIEREDPSLHISTDEDSGQMVLSGMGELHLEISRNRLVSDLKAKCSMGHIRIGYREVVSGSATVHEIYEREILGKKSYAGVTAHVEAISNYEGAVFEEPLGILAKSTIGGNEILITVATTQELEDPTLKIPGWMDPEVLVDNLTNGAMAALSRGPQNFELHSTRVILTLQPSDFRNSSESTPNAFMVAARMGVEKAVRECGTGMMEPFMNVVVSCEEGDVGNVVADITSGAGGGSVLSLDDEADGGHAPTSTHTGGTYDTSSSSSSLSISSEGGERKEVEYIDVSKVYAPPQSYRSTGLENFDEGAHVRTKLVRCRVPLAKMMGYVKHLKSMTKGRGTFVMSMDRFERMSDVRIRNAMR